MTGRCTALQTTFTLRQRHCGTLTSSALRQSLSNRQTFLSEIKVDTANTRNTTDLKWTNGLAYFIFCRKNPNKEITQITQILIKNSLLHQLENRFILNSCHCSPCRALVHRQHVSQCLSLWSVLSATWWSIQTATLRQTQPNQVRIGAALPSVI